MYIHSCVLACMYVSLNVHPYMYVCKPRLPLVDVTVVKTVAPENGRPDHGSLQNEDKMRGRHLQDSKVQLEAETKLRSAEGIRKSALRLTFARHAFCVCVCETHVQVVHANIPLRVLAAYGYSDHILALKCGGCHSIPLPRKLHQGSHACTKSI